MTTTRLSVWLIAPSDAVTPSATPMFPDLNHQRVETRRSAHSPAPVDKGWVDLPGDDVDHAGNMLAIEKDSAIGLFKRMGIALRLSYGEGPVDGRFSNGQRDPTSISRGMATMQTGFAILLQDLEPAVGRWMRWLAPDVHRDPAREADYAVAKRLLALLREAKQAGGVSVLFIPTEVENPHVVPY
jgi:hypothetical protein